MGKNADFPEEMRTPKPDPRHPNVNVTYYCFESFLDFHRCTRLLGKDYEPCKRFQRTYQSICPNSWTEKWTTQIDEGTFAGVLPPKDEECEE